MSTNGKSCHLVPQAARVVRHLLCKNMSRKVFLGMKMRQCLASGGFEIRQWASNFSSVVSHLPSSARSESTELWLTEKSNDPQEPALGLRWHCPTDQLGYKPKPPESETPTMRYIYKVLARQYEDHYPIHYSGQDPCPEIVGEEEELGRPKPPS